MNEKNNKYVIRGSEWVKKTVPNTKQIEEKTTNKEIECTICSCMTVKYVRIVRINGSSSAYLNGVCCDRCIFTHKFMHGNYLIDSENKVFTPETITIGQAVPLNNYGSVDDSTRETYYERLDKYRRIVKNMIKINKALGTFMPTFKQEMKQKIREVSWLDDDVKRAIYEKIE